MATVSVPASGAGLSQPRDCASLITTIAQPFGVQDDGDGRSMALSSLNQAIKELNGRSPLWEFLRTTDSIVLVDGTATYALSATFNKPSKAQLIDSNSKKERPLTYADWETFQDYVHRQEASGAPEVYTFKNVFADGKVEFYPVPDAAATASTVDVTFYKRLTVCTDNAGSLISAPEEVEPWLVTRAQTLLASIKDTTKYPMFRSESLKLWGDLVAYDRRQTDGKYRFTLRNRNTLTGITLIRVGSGFIVV